MKKCLLIAFMCWGCLYAQEEKTISKFGLKLQVRLNADFGLATSFNLQGIYPAFQIRTARGFIHQIEVSGIGWGRFSFGNDEGRNTYLNTGYEFSVPLNIFPQREDIIPYIGIGVNSLISSYFFNPTSTVQFRQSNTNFINTFYLMPGFQQSINERIYLDFSLLVDIGDITMTSFETTDPTIPAAVQNRTDVVAEFFNFQQFAFRFGFGVRL